MHCFFQEDKGFLKQNSTYLLSKLATMHMLINLYDFLKWFYHDKFHH